ncbi:hypothetical protein ES708_06550 [subsurface metagenome]
MTVLDKIKAFFKWYEEGTALLYPKPEAKGAEKRELDFLKKRGKKAAEPPETKVAQAPEKKGDESSSKVESG